MCTPEDEEKRIVAEGTKKHSVEDRERFQDYKKINSINEAYNKNTKQENHYEAITIPKDILSETDFSNSIKGMTNFVILKVNIKELNSTINKLSKIASPNLDDAEDKMYKLKAKFFQDGVWNNKHRIDPNLETQIGKINFDIYDFKNPLSFSEKQILYKQREVIKQKLNLDKSIIERIFESDGSKWYEYHEEYKINEQWKKLQSEIK